MLMVDDCSYLEIRSHYLNNWFPNIVFFDEDLKILDVIKKDSVNRRYKTEVPQNTKYIKISDLYNLINN